MAVVNRLELEVEIKSVENPDVQSELTALGGKSQVPYLVDSKQEVSMYESDDIVNHLQKYYGVKTAPKNRMHISDNVCVSCEG